MQVRSKFLAPDLILERPLRRSPVDWIMTGGSNLLRSLPRAVKRLLAGRPIRVHGDELELETQLVIRVNRMLFREDPAPSDPGMARRTFDRMIRAVPRWSRNPVLRVGLKIPTPDRSIPARLYSPIGLAPGSPLLVYYHGGGGVIGSLDTHDELCAHIAYSSDVRLLSVDYRLAPEHPFPAAIDDANTAYLFARKYASDLGADPKRIGVGGDSSGGTAAAVVCQQNMSVGCKVPEFALLLYPAADLVAQTKSRRLFANGFLLDEPRLTWFFDCYCPPSLRDDPLCSPLRALEAAEQSPSYVYVATAALDPLRDEGEALAEKFARGGAEVTVRRHRGLVHGFLHFASLSPGAMSAISEAVGAVRIGLGVSPTTDLHR